MNPRVVVPELFRRGDRWYVRVQVPSAMQETLQRKEHWISLKTSDRQQAMRVAASVVEKKRAEISGVYNRLMAIRTTVSEFSPEQYLALYREAYEEQVAIQVDLIAEYQSSRFKSLAEFSDAYGQALDGLIIQLRACRGERPEINIMMLKLADSNAIRTPPGSAAEEQLRQICVDSFIESKRNELARLRGQAVHENPNPEVVDPSTGRPRDYVPLKQILARPPEKPVSLTSLVEDFLSNPNKVRTDKTKNSIRGSMAVVIEVLGDTTPLDQITEADCERVRDLLMQLPPNFKKLPELRDRPVEEMVRIARHKGMKRLSPTGVNTYLKWLTSFLKWCQRKGKIATVPTSFGELKVADPVRKEDKRAPFSDDQLSAYFHSRVFIEQEQTNCLYWVSLIALWNGMRSNEICQLDVQDVVCEENVWGFDITHISSQGSDDKSTKTGASIRLIPIHPRLLDFGFLDFHESRLGNAKLFDDIKLGHDGYYSSTFSKKSNRYLKKVGVHGPRHKFHSFRHNFRDALRRGRVDREVGKALGGWTRDNTDAFDIYGAGFPLDELRNELIRVDYPNVDWSHLTR